MNTQAPSTWPNARVASQSALQSSAQFPAQSAFWHTMPQPKSRDASDWRADWPIVAQPFDPQGNRAKGHHTTVVLYRITAGTLAVLLLLVALDIYAPFADAITIPQFVYVVAGLIPFTTFITALDYAYDDHLRSSMPQVPGYAITGRDIQRAYVGRIAISRLALSTPIIRHDPFEGDDLHYFFRFEVLPNDIGRLYFLPTGQVHSYTLYWSERSYDDVELRKRTMGAYCERGYGKPSMRALRSSVKGMRRLARRFNVDMRVRPCTLQIYGTRARLVVPPNAPQLEIGMQDARLGRQIDGTNPLLDTF